MKYRVYPHGGEYIAEILGKHGSSPLLDLSGDQEAVCTFRTEADAETEVLRRISTFGKAENERGQLQGVRAAERVA